MNEKISEIILDNFKKVSKKKVNINDNIRSLGVDSLDLAELVIEAEEKFNISISDAEILKLEFVKDVIELIQNKIQ
ncbi:phosphopantetheine-binding protein [Mycoplasmopsis felis]|uniref:phosphopantetheine-binding protein n=1 Tax=Mycoplasmopsis felis TaxID=33923 RepID=UPI000567C8F4|nr:phosphopantetheine-binding protein [Mycoplasmopsis felis]MCU9938851.1 phosphopantetheine-binding protein [Mycoplasmopsis felis]MCU9939587.1 phosphopantetheine-binding protein [Mycoplasmopsis felis]UWV85089.1 phosphopantetheine-binding protein [Mycoplasmopsis felis]WQQ04738.1 phosphopantetheine-binding protein [Mycoplasmopsis felis]WQQ06923.1 phosphopantetheine-binding protein [Mycoplasmopsis felis]